MMDPNSIDNDISVEIIKKNIRNDYSESNENIEKRIQNIDNRQQQLLIYITNLDSSIHFYQTQLQVAQTAQDKYKLYNNIKHSTELIAQLYNSYKEFENSMFKYIDIKNDNINKMHELIEIKLKNLYSKIGDDGSSPGINDTLKGLAKLLNMAQSSNSDPIKEKLKIDDPDCEI